MVIGGTILIIGLAVTLSTYNSASPGGSYTVMGGTILFGGIYFLGGLLAWLYWLLAGESSEYVFPKNLQKTEDYQGLGNEDIRATGDTKRRFPRTSKERRIEGIRRYKEKTPGVIIDADDEQTDEEA